jgi:hypothetical protein
VELQFAPERVGELAECIRVPGPSAADDYVLHRHLPVHAQFAPTPLMTPVVPERDRSGCGATGVSTSKTRTVKRMRWDAR